MHVAAEQFEADDCVDHDNEEHKQGDVQQGHHGLDDRIEDNLERGHAGDESKWPEHSKGSQRLHIEALQVGLENNTEQADDHDDEVEYVPAVPQVRLGVHDEALRTNLKYALCGEDKQK